MDGDVRWEDLHRKRAQEPESEKHVRRPAGPTRKLWAFGPTPERGKSVTGVKDQSV